MKKKIILIILIIILVILTSYLLNNKNNSTTNSNIVDVKVILNNNCIECTTIDSYIKVYKKSGVKFGNIKKIDYNSSEGKILLQEYNITKLPFIIFSDNLSKYETIANSWEDTFGYINKLGEYIPSDIIPPYFDLKTQKILGLVDMLYIGEPNCDKCYGLADVKKVLNTFGLRFNNIKSINKSSTIGKELIIKYNINRFPVIILSENLSLYKNFSYFWENIGTIEEDRKYILRKPGNLGLQFQSSGN